MSSSTTADALGLNALHGLSISRMEGSNASADTSSQSGTFSHKPTSRKARSTRSSWRCADAAGVSASTFGDACGQASQGGFLVFRRHFQPGLFHRSDAAIQGHEMLAVTAHGQ